MNIVKSVPVTNNDPLAAEEEGSTVVLTKKVYDSLKLVVQILLPAIATAYFALGKIWEWNDIEKVVGSITTLTTFLGVILRVSTSRYYKSDAPYDGKVVVSEDPGGVKGFSLELDGDPEQLRDQQAISFKVKRGGC